MESELVSEFGWLGKRGDSTDYGSGRAVVWVRKGVLFVSVKKRRESE